MIVIVAVAWLRELQNGEKMRGSKNEKLKKNYYFHSKNRDRTSARVRTLRVLATANWRVWPRARCKRVRGLDDEINDDDHTRIRFHGCCLAAEWQWCWVVACLLTYSRRLFCYHWPPSFQFITRYGWYHGCCYLQVPPTRALKTRTA